MWHPRFTLARLLMLVTVIAVVFALVTRQYLRVAACHATIDYLTAENARVTLDVRDHRWFSSMRVPRVYEIDLRGEIEREVEFERDMVRAVAVLNNVQVLYLPVDQDISGADLSPWAVCTDLEEVYVLPPSSLSIVKHWPKLRRLYASDLLHYVEGEGHLSRDAEMVLRQCQQLEWLEINLTDEELAILNDLPRLEWIELNASRLDGSGFQVLVNVPPLKRLSVSNTQINDQRVLPLSRFSDLRELSLHRTLVTDQGISELSRGLPKLEVLDVIDTAITAEGLRDCGLLDRLTRLALRRSQASGALHELEARQPQLEVRILD